MNKTEFMRVPAETHKRLKLIKKKSNEGRKSKVSMGDIVNALVAECKEDRIFNKS